MESLNGHEAGNGGYSQGDSCGNSPFLDPTIKLVTCKDVFYYYGTMGYVKKLFAM
jgi:hypothetical protein